MYHATREKHSGIRQFSARFGLILWQSAPSSSLGLLGVPHSLPDRSPKAPTPDMPAGSTWDGIAPMQPSHGVLYVMIQFVKTWSVANDLGF